MGDNQFVVYISTIYDCPGGSESLADRTCNESNYATVEVNVAGSKLKFYAGILLLVMLIPFVMVMIRIV